MQNPPSQLEETMSANLQDFSSCMLRRYVQLTFVYQAQGWQTSAAETDAQVYVPGSLEGLLW